MLRTGTDSDPKITGTGAAYLQPKIKKTFPLPQSKKGVTSPFFDKVSREQAGPAARAKQTGIAQTKAALALMATIQNADFVNVKGRAP